MSEDNNSQSKLELDDDTKNNSPLASPQSQDRINRDSDFKFPEGNKSCQGLGA